jgi:histidyl-tRNA synthetase
MKREITLKNIKGTYDFLPEKQVIRNKIMDTLRHNFQKYGYLPIETPILNYFNLLAYKYNEDAEILKETYKLTDQGGRDMGLRYDLTIPFCKLIGINKQLSMPFRRYEIGKVFRNGPVKPGRDREFYQCDIDVVGIEGRFIEVEQMKMVVESFKDLDIDINVKWNNRKLMMGILQELNLNEEESIKTISIIDKIEKVPKEAIYKEFDENNISKEKVDKIFNSFNKTVEEYQEDFKNTENEKIKESINEITEINKYLKELKLEDNTTFTPTLARGLGIYTGIVFEFFDKKQRMTCSLGGGGRYDKIITEFMDNGNEYPAVGLSFGLEPIYMILEQEAKNTNIIDLLIIPLETEIECLKLATEIRNKGINVLVETSGSKLKKSMKYADRNSIEYVIIVGSEEGKQIYIKKHDHRRSRKIRIITNNRKNNKITKSNLYKFDFLFHK